MGHQRSLFDTEVGSGADLIREFPPTRFQGSKRKLASLLAKQFVELEGRTVLDMFSGSAVVSYLLKRLGREVTSNDYLLAFQTWAAALVENDDVRLPLSVAEATTRIHPGRK